MLEPIKIFSSIQTQIDKLSVEHNCLPLFKHSLADVGLQSLLLQAPKTARNAVHGQAAGAEGEGRSGMDIQVFHQQRHFAQAIR